MKNKKLFQQADDKTLIIDEVIKTYQLRRTSPTARFGTIESSKSYIKLIRIMKKLQDKAPHERFDIVEANAYKIDGKLYCETDPNCLNASKEDLHADALFEKYQKAGFDIEGLIFLNDQINGENK